MEIDKVVMNIDDRDYLLDRLEAILHDTHCQQYKDEICEAFSKYIVTETASDLKPFDLDAAKAGKPVCTRDGRKARIICFDVKSDNYPILALIEDEDSILGTPVIYTNKGRFYNDGTIHNLDLVMLSVKREDGLIYSCVDGNVACSNPYKTKEETMKYPALSAIIDTIRIEWYE